MKKLILLVSFVGSLFACSNAEKEEPYKPSKEIQPAYSVISDEIEEKKNIPTGNENYDLEETIRILNSLEIAQTQSETFDDFLLYMAKQDYSRVAPDVLEAKLKFFPVLQKMYQLQKEYKEFSTLWMLARSVAAGGKSLRENVDMAGVGLAVVASSATGGLAGGEQAISQAMGAVNSATNAAFDHYAKEEKLKKELKKKIQDVKEHYVNYLSEFAPIYYRYMKEWDRLCLNKDKAYLDIYGGRAEEALSDAEAVLKQSPNNREGLLLKSLSLIELGKLNREQGLQIPLPFDIEKYPIDTLSINEIQSPYFRAASATLKEYLNLYPGKSAPALLLQGVILMDMGKAPSALSYFEQAAIEYPRQAEELKDLLNSYRSRTYLNQSAEGIYLMNLYKSTMEGFGIFSPNFYKAKYYTEQGDLNKSKEEILKHFYRRGNQGEYDCLLSDMNFCEDFLYSSFSPIAPEKSFIDIDVSAASKMMVMKSDDKIKVELENRSDIDLENVRVFLCIHYTDMYKDDYNVVKVPITKNRIEKRERVTLSDVKLDYKDKKVEDITRIRAIIMTDDKICWVDEVKEKERRIAKHFASSFSKYNLIDNSKKKFLSDLSIDIKTLEDLIKSQTRINGKATSLAEAISKKSVKGIIANTGLNELYSVAKWLNVEDKIPGVEWLNSSDNELKIEIPRLLIFLDPVFSLYPIQDEERLVRPVESFLAGSDIRLKFEYEIKEGTTVPFYIYSDFVSFKIDLKRENGEIRVEQLTRIENDK